MKKLLVTGIVLAMCFVGTASDVTVSDAAVGINRYTSINNATTLKSNDLNFSTNPNGTGLLLIGTSECQHPKLKALGDNCWGIISRHEFCPTEYRQRAYKCKKCKETIVVLQAILIKGESK